MLCLVVFNVRYPTSSNGLKINAFPCVKVGKFGVCPLLMSNSAGRVKMQLFDCTSGVSSPSLLCFPHQNELYSSMRVCPAPSW